MSRKYDEIFNKMKDELEGGTPEPKTEGTPESTEEPKPETTPEPNDGPGHEPEPEHEPVKGGTEEQERVFL